MTGIWLSGDKLWDRFYHVPKTAYHVLGLLSVISFWNEKQCFFFHPLWTNNSLVYNCNPSSVFPSVDSILDPTDHLASINCSFWLNECLYSWDAAASPQLVCTEAMWLDNQPAWQCVSAFPRVTTDWCRHSSLPVWKQNGSIYIYIWEIKKKSLTFTNLLSSMYFHKTAVPP